MFSQSLGAAPSDEEGSPEPRSRQLVRSIAGEGIRTPDVQLGNTVHSADILAASRLTRRKDSKKLKLFEHSVPHYVLAA